MAFQIHVNLHKNSRSDFAAFWFVCWCSWVWCRPRAAWWKERASEWVFSGLLTSSKVFPSLMSRESGRNPNPTRGGTVRVQTHHELVWSSESLHPREASRWQNRAFLLVCVLRGPEGYKVSRSMLAGDAAADKNPRQRELPLSEHLCSPGAIL